MPLTTWALILSAVLVIGVFIGENHNYWRCGKFGTWFSGECDELFKKETLIWFMVWVGLTLIMTFFLYLRFDGIDGALDYLSFGGTSIAGMLAGLGILVKQEKNKRVEKDANLIFYFLSVLIILMCFWGYVKRHNNDDVSYYVLFITSMAFLLAIGIRRFTDVWLGGLSDWLMLLSFLINVAVFLSIVL